MFSRKGAEVAEGFDGPKNYSQKKTFAFFASLRELLISFNEHRPLIKSFYPDMFSRKGAEAAENFTVSKNY